MKKSVEKKKYTQNTRNLYNEAIQLVYGTAYVDIQNKIHGSLFSNDKFITSYHTFPYDLVLQY